MNVNADYTLNVRYPDGSTMTVSVDDAEETIAFARKQLEQGKWNSAELSDHRGELAWRGDRRTSSGSKDQPN